jgi:hypothetical protein
MKQFGSHGRIFTKFAICVFFENFVEKIQISLKEWRLLYMKANVHCWSCLAQFSLKWEMFVTKVKEKHNMHILFSVTFLRKSRLYEITLKNTVQPDTPQISIWRMRFSCWIPKATDTRSEYVILIVFPPQQWSWELASVSSYSYTACLVWLYVHWFIFHFVYWL